MEKTEHVQMLAYKIRPIRQHGRNTNPPSSTSSQRKPDTCEETQDKVKHKYLWSHILKMMRDYLTKFFSY